MITDQSVVRDLPGAYEVAICGEDGIPLTDFGTLAPRTLFDEEITIELEVRVAGRATGVVARDGTYARMYKIPRDVEPGMKVRLRVGSEGW